MTAAEKKFCKNCRHYVPANFAEAGAAAEFARCSKSQSNEDVRLNRVDGRPIRNLYCEIARDLTSGCGPDAAWFEASEAEVA